MKLKNLYEIEGYGIVLDKVQNYYPVEEDKPGMYCWGFKYTSGVFEYFYHNSEIEAERERNGFIKALEQTK